MNRQQIIDSHRGTATSARRHDGPRPEGPVRMLAPTVYCPPARVQACVDADRRARRPE